MTRAPDICRRAAATVAVRGRRHGDALACHRAVAALWTAYLGAKLRPGAAITARDAALLLALLKVARTLAGAHNPDDYIDLAGYAAVAGEIAARRR